MAMRKAKENWGNIQNATKQIFVKCEICSKSRIHKHVENCVLILAPHGKKKQTKEYPITYQAFHNIVLENLKTLSRKF